jgi:hypothetical protein
MVFAHQLAVGFFNSGIIRIFSDTQYFIIIFFCHVIPLIDNIQNSYWIYS